MAVVVWVKVLYRHVPGDTEENHEKTRGVNWGLLGHEAGMLTTEGSHLSVEIRDELAWTGAQEGTKGCRSKASGVLILCAGWRRVFATRSKEVLPERHAYSVYWEVKCPLNSPGHGGKQMGFSLTVLSSLSLRGFHVDVVQSESVSYKPY